MPTPPTTDVNQSLKRITSLPLAASLCLIAYAATFATILYEDTGMVFSVVLFDHPAALFGYLAGAFGAAFGLPIIHVAIASCFASKRNPSSRRNIFIGWAVISIMLHSVMALRDLNASSVTSKLEQHEVQNADDVAFNENDVVVTYGFETDDAFLGMKIQTEAIEILEKGARDILMKSFAEQLQSGGYSSKAIPKVTNTKFVSVDLPDMAHFSAAMVWLTIGGAGRETPYKYQYAAGVIGNTLHTVICAQLGGDDIVLMTHPKCKKKLEQAFELPGAQNIGKSASSLTLLSRPIVQDSRILPGDNSYRSRPGLKIKNGRCDEGYWVADAINMDKWTAKWSYTIHTLDADGDPLNSFSSWKEFEAKERLEIPLGMSCTYNWDDLQMEGMRLK